MRRIASCVVVLMMITIINVNCTNYASYNDKLIKQFNDFIYKCHTEHPSPPYSRPRLEVREAFGMGLGTFATEDLNPEDIYMFLPWKCVMTDDKARKELGTVAQGLDDFHALLLYLLREKQKGEKSFFWPYLAVLPPAFDTPYYWSDQELGLLNGSEVIDGVKQERNRIRNQYQYLKRSVIDRNSDFFQPEKAYSYEEYEWATNAMNSRTIWTINGNGKRSLVPLLDAVNGMEGPDPKRLHTSTRDLNYDAVVTRSPWGFKKGEQVFENYGSDNYVNFFSHGFSILNNSHDCVKVRVEYTGDSGSILTELKNNNLPSSGVYCIGKGKVPDNAMAVVRIIAKANGVSEFKILYDILKNKLASYPNDIEFDKQLLQSEIITRRARAAHTFLHEEKRVLTTVMNNIKRFIPQHDEL
jgi:hypothetical protein